jgi:transcriptional regulator with XRE-family HTH domain
MTAPRAHRSTRRLATGMGLFAPPIGGDLLRAMRRRILWSEDRLASCIGVDRTTIAHWENGDRLPASREMQALCGALEARAEERAALATGRISRGGPSVARSVAGEMSLSDHLEILDQPAPPGLEDLHYLILERDMWELAVRQPAATSLLARAYVYHGHHHRMEENWAASRQPAVKALALAASHPEDSATLSRAVILNAAIAALGRPTPTPERGLHLLRERMNWSDAAPEFVAWALADTAKYLALAGRPEAGVPAAREAVRLVERHQNPAEVFLRRCDLAEVLLDSGDPEAALRAVPDPCEPQLPDHRAVAMLLMSDACYRGGRAAESRQWLGEASRLIQSHGLRQFQPRADALAGRF